jgi:hypothetical protein
VGWSTCTKRDGCGSGQRKDGAPEIRRDRGIAQETVESTTMWRELRPVFSSISMFTEKTTEYSLSA